MICTDDTIYEERYAEKIISLMDTDRKYAIVSGNYDENRYVAPHGAGRFIKNSFFEKNHKFYPEIMGFESVILHTAVMSGFGCTILHDAKFEHTRELGKNHHFYEWGASMRSLGYHPLFAISRFLVSFILGKPMGRRGALNMFYSYLSYKPKKDGYYSMHDKKIRDFIRKNQLKEIKNIIFERTYSMVKRLIMMKISDNFQSKSLNLTNITDK